MPVALPTSRSYAQLCGIATALDVVGDRWALLVVRDLLLGPLRFGELAAGLPGLGTNTLTDRLKQLESHDVVRRTLLPPPERATVYELTAYGRELRPILLALGRWGTRSMGGLPANTVSRSRWLMGAMLAFQVEGAATKRPTTWELCLDDGSYAVRADRTGLDIEAGAPQQADVIVRTDEETLHRLLTRQTTPAAAIRARRVSVEGDPALLRSLIELFDFPRVDG